MIDIHNHTLYGVDDGPKDIGLSLEMLRDAAEQGITDVILTTHYRKGMFPYDRERVNEHFRILKEAVRGEAIPIELHPGCEMHVHVGMPETLRRKRVRTLADSNWVLTEYSYDDAYERIEQNSHQLINAGYHPIIAHVERIGCLRKKPKLCMELQDQGIWIQCNAMAVLGKEGFLVKHFTDKLLKHGWVDLIASDAHDRQERPNRLGEAYEYIESRYGSDEAERVLESNPRRILNK